MKPSSAGATGNRLLDLVPADEFRILQPCLLKIEMKAGRTLYEIRSPITEVYFPIHSVLSAVIVMLDGHTMEVATVGNEGMVGLSPFGAIMDSPNKVFAQIGNGAWQADAADFHRQVARLPRLRQTLTNYHHAFAFQVSQSVACNGLHALVERCCRWLLMTHDKVEGDDLALTHEFLSYMLGVRRSGVTEVLQKLQSQGHIRYVKGKITVVNREGLEDLCCECYQALRDEYDRQMAK